MTTYSAKGTAMVGYNVQAAVDTKNHVIVAHEIMNNGSDRAQISLMALVACDAMGTGISALYGRCRPYDTQTGSSIAWASLTG